MDSTAIKEEEEEVEKEEEEEEGSLLCLQEPATCPHLESESKPTPFHPTRLRSFLILSSHQQLVFHVVFPSEF